MAGDRDPIEERFEQLYERHGGEVYRFFLGKGFSPEESHELAQDTFVRVYQGLSEFRGESTARTWIFSIARNLYLNARRHDRAAKRRGTEIPLDELQPPDADYDVPASLPPAPADWGYEGGSGGAQDPPPDEVQDMPGDLPPPEVGRGLDDRSPSPPDPNLDMPEEAPPKGRYSVVELFYATDRKPTGSGEPPKFYGSDRSDRGLRFGLCKVSIPEDHRLGHLEAPSWHRLEFRTDPEKHVVLMDLNVLSDDRFFEELSATLRDSPKNQILLFLHGFNVSFEDAARRTAQMAYDLQFQGASAFYSWPSRGRLSLTGYTHDENNIEWTIPHLKEFLKELATRSGAEAIHLVAHSMGNRALTRALEQLAAVMAEPEAPSFSEVILTAPDIDAEVFRQVASVFRPTARRVTLYASKKDRALRASYKFHGYPRAGDGGENIVVVPGIDTIDASAVDTDLVGHFYYGDNRSVLSDVFHLLRDGKAPKERFGLRLRHSPTGSYWVFMP